MLRDGYFLPKLSSKFVNQKVLQQIRDQKIFSVMQRQVVYRICVAPPPKQVLLLKLHQYLQARNANSGIDDKKQNYPDKDYLVLMIATLSQGNDEIFGKGYLPPQLHQHQHAAANFTYKNNDGLLSNIPQHLLSSNGERSLKLSLLSVEDRAKLKLMQADQRIQKVKEAKDRLEKKLEAQMQKQLQRQAAAAVDVESLKADIQKQMQVQADAYVQQQLQQREVELQRQFHEEWERQSKSVVGGAMAMQLDTPLAKKLVFSPPANLISTMGSQLDDEY